MTGFQNVEDGIVHFFQHIEGVIDAELQAAIEVSMPTLKALAQFAKTNGIQFLKVVGEAAAAAALTGATAAQSEGKTDTEIASAAGQAALAAAETAAGAAAVTIGLNALHGLATPAVTTATTSLPDLAAVGAAKVEGNGDTGADSQETSTAATPERQPVDEAGNLIPTPEPVPDAQPNPAPDQGPTT